MVLPLIGSLLAPTLFAGAGGLSAATLAGLGAGVGSLAQGDDLGEALSTGLISGLTAGVAGKFLGAGSGAGEAAATATGLPAGGPTVIGCRGRRHFKPCDASQFRKRRSHYLIPPSPKKPL